MYFVRRKWEHDKEGKVNEYVAQAEDGFTADAIATALNVATEIGGYNVIKLMSWPESMGAALDCNQTYLTKPIDRSDNYLI
jgi:hypothetical protein